jgi:hypothetical protein
LESNDELVAFVTSATAIDVRGRLIARGEARAIIRRQGVLPADAPPFGETLDTDLEEYGLSLLRASIALRENGGDAAVWRKGLERAGSAFEALVRNGLPATPERGFRRVLGAASYHIAGYSAMAFSLLTQREEDPNFSPAEIAIVHLMLRNLAALRGQALQWLRDPLHADEAVSAMVREGQIDTDELLTSVLTTTVFRALAYFDFALAIGQPLLHEKALELLRDGLRVASGAGAVPTWWLMRIAINLIDDLWSTSLHQVLPPDLDGSARYPRNRELFLAALYTRNCAEVELWPSQIEAGKRAVDVCDDLVVALPTSAGKTRIAELCALICLSLGQRVLIVTPLRALSAQTERSFRRTFGPLGLSVSSLYGASGTVAGDEDALRSRDVVIATPEKLDFALRNDPDLIDDVGLIVLDEGHLIGPGERELRYEVLVQRLLRRSDAAERRIVCLSAILPDGDQLNDLTAWIRSDAEGTAVKSQWRQTRQRYGTLSWTGRAGTLTFDLESDGPFIRGFVEERPPIKPRRTAFPRDNAELTLAAAWRFAEEGKRTLVFCTQRDHVEGYAERVVDLFKRGFLPSLLSDSHATQRAKVIGTEWLGANHPAVTCLDVGVAIHHGRLPAPFLRELESLLNQGVLTVTVASPTLAQGLNLNAAVLLVPTLYRAGELLTGEEFANVAGRAGRAFVDLEGLIVHVMFKPEAWRYRAWRELVRSSKARNLESGLIQIAAEILERLAASGVFDRPDAFEYLANHRKAWHPEEELNEDQEPLDHLVEKLDTTVLGLVEALDADAENLPELIDKALAGSLWSRQISRREPDQRERQLALLRSRSALMWRLTTADQRRGHFAMGVGLDAGLALDEIADELSEHLDEADRAALSGDLEVLAESATKLAKRLLTIRPFTPEESFPDKWMKILASWLGGEPIEIIGTENMRFLEDAFAYRLVWAIEALRVRREALGWESDIITGCAAACIEAGVPRFVSAMLIRAGLPSRIAAIVAIDELNPAFVDNGGMLEWLRSDEVSELTETGKWPTPETAEIWQQFVRDAAGEGGTNWTVNEWKRSYSSTPIGIHPDASATYRIEVEGESAWVCTPDFQRLARLQRALLDSGPAVLSARYQAEPAPVIVRRVGRGVAKWLAVPT